MYSSRACAMPCHLSTWLETCGDLQPPSKVFMSWNTLDPNNSNPYRLPHTKRRIRAQPNPAMSKWNCSVEAVRSQSILWDSIENSIEIPTVGEIDDWAGYMPAEPPYRFTSKLLPIAMVGRLLHQRSQATLTVVRKYGRQFCCSLFKKQLLLELICVSELTSCWTMCPAAWLLASTA